MTFLPDSYIDCSSCQGMRYKEEILEIKWNDKNIAQILDLTFKEAVNFFEFDYLLTSTFQNDGRDRTGLLKTRAIFFDSFGWRSFKDLNSYPKLQLE